MLGKLSLSRRLAFSALTVVLLLVAYVVGTQLAQMSAASTTEIGHEVEGDLFEGLVLDASLYGTETVDEKDAIEDCYEDAVGVRTTIELATPTYDELYAWRQCAVDLGIESKVMRTEPATDDELESYALDANTAIRKQVKCLERLGWKVVQNPADEAGLESFEVDAKHDSETGSKLAADVTTCGGHGEEDHDS